MGDLVDRVIIKTSDIINSYPLKSITNKFDFFFFVTQNSEISTTWCRNSIVTRMFRLWKIEEHIYNARLKV